MSLFERLFGKSCTTVLHITSPNGFHMRPAARFVAEAKKFSATIEAEVRGQSVNAKQLNALLSLGLEKGDHFDLVCRGKDAQEASERLSALFETLMEEEPAVQTLHTEAHHYQTEGVSGKPVAPGIAIAPLWHLAQTTYQTTDVFSFSEALTRSLNELETLSKEDAKRDQSTIFAAQHALLAEIGKAHDTLDSFEAEIARHQERLRGGKMEAKISDYGDILRRVRSHMGYRDEINYPDTPFILYAEDLLPSQVEQLPSHTSGVALLRTSAASHTAILLRAAGIPSMILSEEPPHTPQEVILDAHSGLLLPNPDTADLDAASKRLDADRRKRHTAHTKRFEQTVTTQGKSVTVLANVTDPTSAHSAKEAGAEGIGLLRTEFLFTQNKPDLQTQIDAYGEIFALFEDVTIRTLDVGGDKALPYIDLPDEPNPFLGIRGIRLLRTHPDLIAEQLQAIFTAAKGRAIKVMFPMIATPEEFIEAKRFAQKIAHRHNIDISHIAFGMMAEVPSVVFEIDKFNEIVDFYSIGSNDLAQYLFAIERTHPTLTIDPHADALFGAIEKITKEATKPVSLCGELAGDTTATARLIEAGLERLSVSAQRIAPLKEAIRDV